MSGILNEIDGSEYDMDCDNADLRNNSSRNVEVLINSELLVGSFETMHIEKLF